MVFVCEGGMQVNHEEWGRRTKGDVKISKNIFEREREFIKTRKGNYG